MRKLFFIYAAAIAFVFAVPVLISTISGKLPAKVGDNRLPKTVSVYFADRDEVGELNLEDYIKGVLPAEMPATFNDEALKAQAVAARTYTVHKYEKFTNDPGIIPEQHKGAVICTDATHCEAYSSKEQLLEKKGQQWMDQYYDKMCKAVDDTTGEIMVYEDQPILAVFHSASSGGKTESSEDAWGSSLPYLVSVETAGEEQRENYYTTATFSEDDFVGKMKEKYPDVKISDDRNSWFENIILTAGGEVKTIDICGVTMKGIDVRNMFSLKSCDFTVEILDGDVVFTVEGSGHGVGMSQYGANYMAGTGSTYTEILEKYYQGAALKKY